MTEYQALAAVFCKDGPSPVTLARRIAPEVALIATGHLSDPERVVQLLDDGAI